jgi:hypothetical protein
LGQFAGLWLILLHNSHSSSCGGVGSVFFSFRGKVRHKVYGANNTNKTHKHFRWISPSNAVILMAGAFNYVATAAAAVVGLFAVYFLRVGENGR